MKFLSVFIAILEASIKRNGSEKVLTLGHLLNLLKMSLKHYGNQCDKEEQDLNNLEHRFYMEERGDVQ